MRGAVSPLPTIPSWRGAQLKHTDNFTFTFENNLACRIHNPLLFLIYASFHCAKSYTDRSRGSSVSVGTRLRAGRPGSDSWQGK
jgi:hypothetical protein